MGRDVPVEEQEERAKNAEHGCEGEANDDGETPQVSAPHYLARRVREQTQSLQVYRTNVALCLGQCLRPRPMRHDFIADILFGNIFSASDIDGDIDIDSSISKIWTPGP